MRKIILVAIVCFFAQCVSAQVSSPEKFLGYELGSRYTEHHRVVAYFAEVAKQVPGMVSLEKYGETNGRRPLYLATVTSAENLQKIATIKANNLAIQNGNGNTADALPIVWLSYNVHGNEPSSSEAAMRTLYELVTKPNAAEWLKKTVVLMDPCLNPDGRDRYANWYNDMQGKYPNADENAREHNEPWPGGRLNHYNYDLNRDWAWQTQVETQQRMKLYQQWMPQVHIDFHEQSVNAPYYFAPAAEPYHEVITDWQREFQKRIGKNHAGYFDEKGWLYFTNEIFDLLYPSYGDTYPMFNGAIGMTYEQGGGPAGGILAEMRVGDTLSLKDRIAHHHTTGLSTVETAYKNASELMSQYAKYFKTAVAGDVGVYKSYVIKNNGSDNLGLLKKLLTKNNIRFTTGQGSGSGYNYNTGKEAKFSYDKNDIIVSNAQPQAVLVKALLEPQPKISDTITYDITAWALPYAYGLEAYASKQNMAANGTAATSLLPTLAPNAFGYVLPWKGIPSAKLVTKLLQENVRVRFAEKAFTSNGKDFAAGSVILLAAENEKRNAGFRTMLDKLSREYEVPVQTVSSGMVEKGLDFGSASVHYMKAPRVMMVTGEGVNPNAAGEIWNFFDKELEYPVTLVNASDFDYISLEKYDVIILPTGRYPFLANDEKAEDLHKWIQNGGRLVAFEAAVRQLSKMKWSNLKLKVEADDKKEDTTDYSVLKIYDERERTAISGSTPGAIYKVEVDNTHPLMYGYEKNYYTLKMSDDVYGFMKDGWNVGIIKKDKPVAGYVGYRLAPKLQDGVIFAVQEEGRGVINYITDDIMFRSFWQNGKLMLANAVFMVGN